MKRIKSWTAIALPVLVASAALTAAPSATAAPAHTLTPFGEVTTQAYSCKPDGRAGVTNARTPVHTGPSGNAPVTQYLPAGRTVHKYLECISAAGNIWYEITGKLDEGPTNGRFIYSGYL
ncbi:hypothetical protein ACIGJO_27340 [Streptomyces sp. NPDC079020]|uniref:hypothetical protein n=1 Tax=Streptomyces sp. NPDC079020 TaxID=3365722 RepID=UPI0037CF0900